jgi:hypothetical protein
MRPFVLWFVLRSITFLLIKKSIGETMKKLQRFCASIVLMLAVALSSPAGDISMPGVTTPPPPRQSSVTSDMSAPVATTEGDTLTPGTVELDPVTEAALSLLQSLLSLF